MFPYGFDLVLAQHYIDNDSYSCKYIIICIQIFGVFAEESFVLWKLIIV